MAKKFVGALVFLILCSCLPHAFGMGSITEVTRENQAVLGLNFTISAERISEEAVLVSMEIPRKGKLKNLRSVQMRIGGGRPLVEATLQTTPDKNGSWVVTFQLSSELANKCSIDLNVPSTARTYALYAVQLKSYVTDRK